MQEFNGTKGPWEVFNNDGEDMVIQSGSLERGRGWIGYTCIAAEFQNKEDALLIAAAPELLEALRQLRDYVEDVLAVSTEDCDQQHPLMLATSVISKALGQ